MSYTSGKYIDVDGGKNSVDRTGKPTPYGGSKGIKVRIYASILADYVEINRINGDSVYMTPTGALNLAMVLFGIAEEAGVVPKE